LKIWIFLLFIAHISLLIKIQLKSILASGGYPRPNLLPGRDPTLGLHHPSDVLARPFADQVRPFPDQVRPFPDQVRPFNIEFKITFTIWE